MEVNKNTKWRGQSTKALNDREMSQKENIAERLWCQEESTEKGASIANVRPWASRGYSKLEKGKCTQVRVQGEGRG